MPVRRADCAAVDGPPAQVLHVLLAAAENPSPRCSASRTSARSGDRLPARGFWWVKWVVAVEVSDAPPWLQPPSPLQ